MPPVEVPSTSEIYTRPKLIERHPTLLNKHRLDWAIRNRDANGLTAAGAVFDSPCGEILVHEPKFIAWLLGLSSRAKPRRTRTAEAATS